jgi:hypothetical protein
MTFAAKEESHFAAVDAAAEQIEMASDQYEIALADKIEQFHRDGGLWIDNDHYSLNEAQDLVFVSDEFGDWYERKQTTAGRLDQEALGREYAELYPALLNRAIEEIAAKALAAERKAYLEDIAA